MIEVYKRKAVCIPINPKLNEQQIQYIIEHCDPHHIYRLGQHESRSPTLALNDNEDRFIIYTSGSTSAPKGVLLSEAAVSHNAKAVAELHQFGPANPHASCLPLFHCNALMMSLLGCYYAEAPCILLTKFNPHTYFDIVAANQVKTASIVPALLNNLLDAAPPWPEQLNYLITAAAPLFRHQAKQFFELYGPRIRQGYGMTEAVNFSFVSPLLDNADFIQQYIDQWPPVGKPLKDTEYRIKNNEVQVKGPNLLKSYWKNPQATQECMDEDWLKTGDTGYVRDGLLVLNGRIKEVINRGGEKFYPLDVEQEWKKHLNKSGQYAAFACQHSRLFEDYGLFIEQPEPDELTALLKSTSYRPACIQTGSLPKTSTGKVQRRRMTASSYSIELSEHDFQACNQEWHTNKAIEDSIIGKQLSLLAQKLVGIRHPSTEELQSNMISSYGARFLSQTTDTEHNVFIRPAQRFSKQQANFIPRDAKSGDWLWQPLLCPSWEESTTSWTSDVISTLPPQLADWGVSFVRFKKHLLAALVWGRVKSNIDQT